MSAEIATLSVETVRPPTRPERTVVNCYSLLHQIFPDSGLFDLTEGIYNDNPDVSYEAAQSAQAKYLLDEAGCVDGTRLLEIGCGYGTLLSQAADRETWGTGISISPEQVRFCRQRGLDVHRLSYLDLDACWPESFDAVIANGSIEHFVQPQDAVTGHDDRIYRRLFRTVRNVLSHDSPSRRFVTTTIHFARPPDPRDLLRFPLCFPWGSDNFHFALLAQSFGGWYPHPDQLERCAAGYFDLVKTVDGTRDYCWTSEEWLRRAKRHMAEKFGTRVFLRMLPQLLRQPRHTVTMLVAVLVAESWNWQFRTDDPPTRLLRQTWECRSF